MSDWADEKARELITPLEGYIPADFEMWHAQAIAKALREARGAWKDIASCPKDGTLFLAADMRDGQTEIARWGDDGVIWWDDYTGNQFTHWLPLPAPPTHEWDE